MTYSAGLEALGAVCDPSSVASLERLRKLAEDAATAGGHSPAAVMDARKRGVDMATSELQRFKVDCENIRDRVGIWSALNQS